MQISHQKLDCACQKSIPKTCDELHAARNQEWVRNWEGKRTEWEWKWVWTTATVRVLKRQQMIRGAKWRVQASSQSATHKHNSPYKGRAAYNFPVSWIFIFLFFFFYWVWLVFTLWLQDHVHEQSFKMPMVKDFYVCGSVYPNSDSPLFFSLKLMCVSACLSICKVPVCTSRWGAKEHQSMTI